MVEVAEQALQQLEREHPAGISSADILAFFAAHDIRFSEATLRKWVQLGLLPRSVRVGRKGKHQGSKGMYPVRVIRQILRIKEMMAQNLTIEEIQHQFLFVRGDVEALQWTLDKIFKVLEEVSHERSSRSMGVRALTADLNRARSLATELLERIEDLERRLSSQAPAEQPAGRKEKAAS